MGFIAIKQTCSWQALSLVYSCCWLVLILVDKYIMLYEKVFVLQNFVLPSCFPYITFFSIAIRSAYFLLVGLLLQFVTVSVQGTSKY